MKNLLLGIVLISVSAVSARDLSFEDRVRAQEAIERVTYSHQIGTTKSFDEAVSRAVLEQKVRTYLEQSVALESIWHAPVTGTMLRREMERQSARTRMPDWLKELHAALENDPFLVAECLARPALVDRLSRSFFAFDETIHGVEKRRAEALRRGLVERTIDPHSESSARAVVTFVREGAGEIGRRRVELSEGEWTRWRARLPRSVGEIGALVEDRESFSIRVILEETDAALRVASFTVSKKDWHEWWEGIASALDHRSAVVAASSYEVLPAPAGDRDGANSTRASFAAEDTWSAIGTGYDPPPARSLNTAVWTGSEMIVWGGIDPAGDFTGTGGRYDPATDTWSGISALGAPAERSLHTAIWTGSRVLVWGGENTSGRLNDGASYDPASDSWNAISGVGAPAPRAYHSAVWTGSEMIVWGGDDGTSRFDSGGRYDPLADTWTATSTSNAPEARYYHTAIWTGARMVVWGGFGNASALQTGGRYDPASNTWAPTSTIDAPPRRAIHTAVWTGATMIVWGGKDVNALQSGGRYDPIADTWLATHFDNDTPLPRYQHTAVWTGTSMIVWGGWNGTSTFGNGSSYEPATGTWSALQFIGTPTARSSHVAVWTGSLMIVWGGSAFDGRGWRYDPSAYSWTPTGDAAGPLSRGNHGAVWTGSRMIVWGGGGISGAPLASGGLYDPATDQWGETSTVGAPPARTSHTTLWTGARMIVWGGLSDQTVNTGAQYDPIADSWVATSILAAPSARTLHTAVWTGSEMIVWGGRSATTGPNLSSGGRYDPVADAWTSTSTSNAPVARAGHTAVWTGSEMIVWAGLQNNGHDLNSGSRYDPALDRWRSTSDVGVPFERAFHTAVWTGARMIVWGGKRSTTDFLNGGGRYDPLNDKWSATPTQGAPMRRAFHTAVWIGGRMVVWGGAVNTPTASGGRYELASNTWTPTSLLGAPPARFSHTAVVADDTMIVWGGFDEIAAVKTGGVYVACLAIDEDEDGFTKCEGDCNDGSSAIHPGAVETCNGFDDDCDGSVDNVFLGRPALTAGRSGTITDLVWSTEPGAVSYDAVKGDLETLRNSFSGNFTLATTACLGNDLASTSVQDTEVPLASEGLWYLVRSVGSCGNGSYDEIDGSQEGGRDAEIAASGFACP